jgi:hypothetical protein
MADRASSKPAATNYDDSSSDEPNDELSDLSGEDPGKDGDGNRTVASK